MKDEINLQLYKIKDIFIASTLYALGKKIDSTEWVDNECYFLFEDEQGCNDLEKKYYANELKISPKVLFDSFKTIKSMIYSR